MSKASDVEAKSPVPDKDARNKEQPACKTIEHGRNELEAILRETLGSD